MDQKIVFFTVSAFLIAVPLFFLSVYLFRRGSEKERLTLPHSDRRKKIILNFILGIFAPWPLCVGLILLVGNNKAFVGDFLGSDRFLILAVAGTLCTMTGLPFIGRMTRLIHSDSKVFLTLLFLGPYGFLLWFGVNLCLVLIFIRITC